MAGPVELDSAKVRDAGPQAIRQLARLASAIMARQALGDEFHQSVKIEVGNAVALLVGTVKEGNEHGED